jgi:mRNA-degrading endonuclease toxin of MazEF toxin-antitoxin module
MPSQTPTVVKTGDIYWCEPDPKDTVGSEQKEDRPWVIVSLTALHRGNCVVGIPLTKNLSKARAHLIAVPRTELTMDGNVPPYDSVALTDQIRCLDKTRLRRKAGTMSVKGLNAMKLGIERLFGL